MGYCRCENSTQPACDRCENLTQSAWALQGQHLLGLSSVTFTNLPSWKIVLINAHPPLHPARSLINARGVYYGIYGMSDAWKGFSLCISGTMDCTELIYWLIVSCFTFSSTVLHGSYIENWPERTQNSRECIFWSQRNSEDKICLRISFIWAQVAYYTSWDDP